MRYLLSRDEPSVNGKDFWPIRIRIQQMKGENNFYGKWKENMILGQRITFVERMKEKIF